MWKKTHEQSKLLEKYITLITQNRNKARNDFGKDFYTLLNNAFLGKTVEIVRNRLRLELIKKYDHKKNMKQSELTFTGNQKSDENFDSYSFKQNEVKTDKPIYLGFATLELSKLHMYETLYDKLQPYFGQEKIQLHYIDTDAFVLRNCIWIQKILSKTWKSWKIYLISVA